MFTNAQRRAAFRAHHAQQAERSGSLSYLHRQPSHEGVAPDLGTALDQVLATGARESESYLDTLHTILDREVRIMEGNLQAPQGERVSKWGERGALFAGLLECSHEYSGDQRRAIDDAMACKHAGHFHKLCEQAGMPKAITEKARELNKQESLGYRTSRWESEGRKLGFITD